MKEKDAAINALTKQLEELRENEEINKAILLENIRLKEDLKYKEDLDRLNERTIWNLQEQLEVYKDCIEALSRARD